ncbi:HK97-gp10 family putative phage morphogenesis protein [Methyloceanibacter caenitepidi]|uniref:HK97-gp10 family putative phage morphogenesis protein n=1 Tax=Methyloceanibacter caenitepidi TaxID=1384459 RepID=UPI003CC7A937
MRGAGPVITASVKGLEALQRRLAARGLERDVRETLAGQAEAIRAEAALGAPGQVGETIETIDVSVRDRPVFAVGTRHRAARFLEFGTRKMRARPFLWPVFRARLPRVKQELTNTLRARWAKH